VSGFPKLKTGAESKGRRSGAYRFRAFAPLAIGCQFLESRRLTPTERWLPLALWLAVIHIFSTDAFSGTQTFGFFEYIARFLMPGISSEALEFLHAVARKAGHVSEYFVLGLLTLRAFRGVLPDSMPAENVTMAFVLAVASGDEFHQMLTAFRTGSFVDVGYDCLGAVAALWMATRIELRRAAGSQGLP
jgi:VanZ family protein